MDICYLADSDSILVKRWIHSFKDDFESCVISFGKDIVKGVTNYLVDSPSLPSIFPRIIKIKKIDPKGEIENQKHLHFTRFTKNVSELVINIVKKINPKILHAHYLTGYGFLSTLCGVKPIINSIYGNDIYITPWENEELKKRAKTTLNKSDVITIDARNMRDYIVSLGCDEKKVEYIPMCADTSIFNPKNFKEKNQEKDYIILSFRNLDLIYDIETLILSISKVTKEIPNVKFLIAGKGDQEEYLKKLCIKLRVNDKVIFLGKVPYNKVPELINKADVCVSTALSDASPNSVSEGMAMEKPYIATNVGGVPEIIENGKNGILIPTKSPEILAEKILFLLRNKKKANKIGKIARKKIIRDYDWRIWSKRMKRIYLRYYK